jgi:hypothetical protein
MFDYLPTPPLSRESACRSFTDFIANFGAWLALASSRLGGEEGAALVHAFRDMVVDSAVHPHQWPIDELIALFRNPQERRDTQVEQMVRRLERIRQEIGRLGSLPVD